MFKRFSPIVSIVVVLSMSTSIYGQNDNSNNQSVSNIEKALNYLGGYMGYNLSTKNPNKISSTPIIDPTSQQLLYTLSVYSFLSAIPVFTNQTYTAMSNLVPSGNQLEIINELANGLFGNQQPSFNSAQLGSGLLTAIPLVDQQPYQQTPYTQLLLNTLAPSQNNCQTYQSSSGETVNWLDNCNFLPPGVVDFNAIFNGDVSQVPSITCSSDSTNCFFNSDGSISTKYAGILQALSFNTLTGPLLFSTAKKEASGQSPGSSEQGDTGSKSVLQPSSQLQAAYYFIRILSSINREALPTPETWDKVTQIARNDNNQFTELDVQNARFAIAKYLNDFLSWNAQTSVARNNFLYHMAKRMPQDNLAGNDQSTVSQALTEYSMASHRLYDPRQSSDNETQWVQKISKASPATVEKEMVILLAEINYQMYLNRQILERILLTNSVNSYATLYNNKPDSSGLDSIANPTTE